MSDDLEKISTPRGNALSMTSLKPDSVALSYSGYPSAAPGQGAEWFGPLQPLRPIAPPEVAGRQFDYAVGYNLNVTSRPYEPIDFKTLRYLADSYDPVRVIIERRKDQMCKMPWKIRLRHEDGGRRPTHAQLTPKQRQQINTMTKFFRFPAENLNFRSWLRQLLEDLLVLDAPTVFCERDSDGNLIALPIIDGGTINPILNDQGRRFSPQVWDGTPFDWLGTKVTPANIREIGGQFVDNVLYMPVYTQVLKGLGAVRYTTWDLIQRPQNLRSDRVFGRSPVEQIVTTINIAMRRTLSQLDYLREGNQPDSIYGLPDTWSPDKIQQFQDYWDNLHTGNWSQRRKMKFVPGGQKSNYVEVKEKPLHSEFDLWLVRIVCLAFSYPVAAFTELNNRSTAEQGSRQADQEGTEPLKLWFSDMATEIINREFPDGDDYEFVFTEEQEIDPKVQSEIISTYVGSGILTINQGREKIGEAADPNPAASTLMALTKNGYVPVGVPPDLIDETDGADAVKLHKITMSPPPGEAPFKSFTLGSGTTYRPDFTRNGAVIVKNEADAIELEREGWRRTPLN